MTTKLARILGLILVGALIGVFAVPHSAQAAPAAFLVTNTNDTGAGSLRQAITQANANGNPSDQDTITFTIPTVGDVSIQPTTQLSITQSVRIDGYSQSDSEENTASYPEPFNGNLRIELDLSVSGGIAITSSNVTLRGLAISGSEDGNLLLDHADNFKLFASYIDTSQSGLVRRKSATSEQSVMVHDSQNVLLGGTSADERNIFGYCITSCIDASGSSTGLIVRGNYVGLGSDGVSNLSAGDQKGTGIVLHQGADSAVIGGLVATEGNTFFGNRHGALYAEDIDNLRVQANKILANRDDVGYQASGMSLGGVTHSLIGSDNPVGKNILAGNIGGSVLKIARSTDTNAISSDITILGNNFGVLEDNVSPYLDEGNHVWVDEASNYISIRKNIIQNTYNMFGSKDGVDIVGGSQNVSVLENSIYNHTGSGIDINDNGADSDDTGDGDSGTNTQLNRPAYISLQEAGGNTNVGYRVDVPAGSYRIEFFNNTVADSPGPGEGETFLGYQTITKTGSGTQIFATTLTGTGHTNITLTATKIDNSSPSGYGPTSEFGGQGAPISDLTIEKRLMNPDDLVTGRTLQYEMKVTNNGPSDFDVGTLSNSSPGQDTLIIDVLPPELAFSSINGGNIGCVNGGPGSATAYGPAMANHSDYSLVLCGYSAGSHMMHAGESLTTILEATVLDDTNPVLTNYAVLTPPSNDPDLEVMAAAFTSGDDILDELTSHPVNNFASATPPVPNVDLAVDKRILNPEDAVIGGQLRYEITVSNVGTSRGNIGYFDGSIPGQKSLLTDVLPPNLAYTSVSGPNLVCTSYGPGSAGGVFGPALSAHATSSVVFCDVTGGAQYILPGQSITYVLTATVIDDSDPDFINYVLAGVSPYDPDLATFGEAYSSGGDMLDYLLAQTSVNNIAYAHSRPSDLSIEKTLNDPGHVAPGAEIHYTVTIKNNGPYDMDLSLMDGSGNPLLTGAFVDLMPSQLTFLSSSNPDIVCTGIGPASAAPSFRHHAEANILACRYTGPSAMLANGASMSTVLTARVDGAVGNGFTNYAILGQPKTDPDSGALRLAAVTSYSGADDLIDKLLADPGIGLAVARYDKNPLSSILSGLAQTGEALALPVIGALTLILAGVGLYRYSSRKYAKRR